MSLVDTLVKKIEELTRSVNSIKSSSKKIHDLPDISGEQIYVAASNGLETGKFLIPVNDNQPIEPNTKWQDINLGPSSSFFINNEVNSYNFFVNTSGWVSGVPSVKGFTNGNPSDGLVGYIRNSSTSPIILKHNITDGFITIPLFLSSESDYFLNPNEILFYKFSSSRNRCEITVYNINSIVPLRPTSEVFTLNSSDITQPNISLILRNTPNLNEFVSVFINGVFINPDDIIIVENQIIIAKSNISYVINEGMKITVNYKY